MSGISSPETGRPSVAMTIVGSGNSRTPNSSICEPKKRTCFLSGSNTTRLAVIRQLGCLGHPSLVSTAQAE